MSGLRTGIPNNSLVAADDRIPFPRTDTPTRCQDDPHLFAIEDVTDHTQREKTLAKAKRACSGCPIATGCLKWALANKELTPTGVWAATTARERTKLRKDLVQRLGDDWVGMVAKQDRRRQEKQRAAHLAPPAVREQMTVRPQLELTLTQPAPTSSRKSRLPRPDEHRAERSPRPLRRPQIAA